MDKNNIYSFTAHIDLLGFSSHLVLSSYDLRTKIGKEAIARLRILEKAVDMIEDELIANPIYYPESFRILRFNDSIILGIDINAPIIPEIGKPNEEVKYTRQQLSSVLRRKKNNILSGTEQSHFTQEATKAAQFLGIVSRIHNYINEEEYKIHMAGCRTVISSGLRYKFVGRRNKKEDFYSANFSLANAYIANDLGSKYGFAGNKCFLENNVARICSYDPHIAQLFGYTKFLLSDKESDPYSSGTAFFMGPKYEDSKPFETTLFNKRYVFREINTVLASNLQLFPKIMELVNEDFTPNEDSYYGAILSMIKDDTPSLENINKGKGNLIGARFAYPFLFESISLEKPVIDSYEEIKSIRGMNDLI